MELFRALGALCEPPTDESVEICRLLELGGPPDPGDYEDLFLFQLYPYASVYLGPEGKVGGEARDRVAGFWRALELDPPAEPDHLALMLGLYARLAELEAEASDERARRGWRHARMAWFWEHLASWLPVYLLRVTEIGPDVYRAWADTLVRALADAATDLGPPAELPLQQREAPGLDDPRRAGDSGGGAAFLEQLLSPARTGFVLVGSDLAGAAAELELALRAGERRFVLEALLAQESVATLDWLAGFADAGARRLGRRDLTAFEPATRFWRDRAAASASLLRELADDARS